MLLSYSLRYCNHLIFIAPPCSSSSSSRHRDHLIFIAPSRSSSSSSRRRAHLHCCAVRSSHHCAVERSIRCAFGRFTSQFIVAPLMSRALFIATPLRLHAQAVLSRTVHVVRSVNRYAGKLKFIVAPSRSRAKFQVAPSRSRAQVHCRAVEVASSFSSRVIKVVSSS